MLHLRNKPIRFVPFFKRNIIDAKSYSTSLYLPHFLPNNEDKKNENKRRLHSSSTNHSSLAIALGCLGGAGALYGTSILIDKYQQQATTTSSENKESLEGGAASTSNSASANGTTTTTTQNAGWFGSLFANKGFYEGGFEEVMTKREAALILGIRESASREKVREAHQRLMRLNHPDTGGSEYMAQKINEAKEKLLNSSSAN